MTAFAAGDILGCSGNSWQSAAIATLTYGLPWYSLSHVMILAPYQGQLAIYESTMGCSMPCLAAGCAISGVQVHPLRERIENYDGKVWHYPLASYLNAAESQKLEAYLTAQLGKAYDELGAFEAGGLLWSLWNAKRHPAYQTSMFCSKLCAAAHAEIGRFNTRNINQWSPNHFVRTERREKVLLIPGRLK